MTEELSVEDQQLLDRVAKAKEKHRLRQKEYIKRQKRDNPNWNKEHAEYMRKYNAEVRGRLQKIEDKIGYIPKTIDIPKVEPEKVDLRTKRGRRAVMTNDIKPSFQDRKYELEQDTIEGYIKKLNVIHKFFMNGNNIPGPIKIRIKTVMGSIESFDKIPEIQNEMPYLKDADETITALRKKYYNDNSFKAYLNPITVLTSHIRDLSEQYQKYTRVAKNTNEAVEEFRKQNISKEEDKNKIIDLRNMKANLENMGKLSSLRDKVIYGFYTLMPPRRLEVRLLKLTKEKNLKKLQTDDNYVILSSPMKVVYNNYKTYKEFGQQVYDIPDDLAKVIELYIKEGGLKPDNYLFHLQKEVRLPVAESNFSNIIASVFQKVHGERISVRFIRQSYASGLTKMSFAEREKLAIAMGHSLIQNLKYSKHLDVLQD